MDGTRVGILEEIVKWSRDLSSPTICWLSGMAGIGKTTIACSFCERLDREGRLAGSFFCSRTGDVRHRDVVRIIPTLAYLLARKDSAFKTALVRLLQDNPDVASQRVANQVTCLLQELLPSASSFNFTLVIDALDECQDESAIQDMLTALIACAPQLPTGVKILITSRPERSILDTDLSNADLNRVLKLHELDEAVVAEDIRRYIKNKLSDLPPHVDPYVDQLAAMSGGLFIFAATAVKYIRDRNSPDRIKNITKIGGPTPLSQKPLDSMYSLILKGSLDPLEPSEVDLLERTLSCILTMRSRLSIRDISTLLAQTPNSNIEKEHVREALKDLHSVMRVPEDDDSPNLNLLHASFGDYLTSAIRKPPLSIDTSLGHRLLSYGSLGVMRSNLCFNLSRSHSSHEHTLRSSDQRVTSNILAYSCLHWAHHLEHVHEDMVPVYINDIKAALAWWAEKQLLFWLESLSLLETLPVAIHALSTAEKWLEQHQPTEVRIAILNQPYCSQYCA